MAKKGMKRPNDTHTKKRNEVMPVPSIQQNTGFSNEVRESVASYESDAFNDLTDLGKDNPANDNPFPDVD